MMSSATTTPLPEHQQEIERNFKFNLTVNALDGATYWFGYSFIAPTVILPLYISHFTDNPIIIGLIPFISTAGFLLPQLFTSNAVERAPRKKIFPVNIGFFTERVPVMLLPVSAAIFARSIPALALVLFLLLYAWYGFGAGLIIVGWQDMVAKIIPADRRGRFFGLTQFIGNATGILSAFVVPLVLGLYEFPTGYVIAFSAAAVLIFLSWVFLSLTREPAVYTNKPAVSQMDYLRSLPDIVRKDHNFLRYLVFSSLYSLGSMASGFLIVYSSQHWNLPDSVASQYFIALQVGQTLANLFFGFFADHKGHKLTLEIGVLISVLSFALTLLAPNPAWFYPIFFLRGAVLAAMMISGISIVLDFTGPENRPTYIGLANTIPGIFSAIAPLLGGWLANVTGYPAMFIVSTVISLASVSMLRWTVREPRQERQHEPDADSTLAA